jgi:hypothetical protein
MKKIILLIVLLVGFISLQAQVARVNIPLTETEWFIKTYTGLATDTLGTVTATTWSYDVPINKFDGVFFISQIKLADKTTGADGVCTIQPQGRYFDNGTFVNIGSAITWTGIGSVDSLITIASVTTKVYYPYIRILVTNTGGKSKIVWNKLVIKR